MIHWNHEVELSCFLFWIFELFFILLGYLLPDNYPLLLLVSVMTCRKLTSGIHGRYSSLTHKKNHTHSFSFCQKKKTHHKVLFSFHVLFPSCWVLLRIPIPHLNRDVFWPWLLREIIILSERSPVDFSQLFLFIWLKYCCCWFWFHNHSFFLAIIH